MVQSSKSLFQIGLSSYSFLITVRMHLVGILKAEGNMSTYHIDKGCDSTLFVEDIKLPTVKKIHIDMF